MKPDHAAIALARPPFRRASPAFADEPRGQPLDFVVRRGLEIEVRTILLSLAAQTNRCSQLADDSLVITHPDSIAECSVLPQSAR